MPISLMRSFYKMVKVIVGRLITFMYMIISTKQPIFIKGRNLVDEGMVVNEIIDFDKKSKKSSSKWILRNLMTKLFEFFYICNEDTWVRG